MSCAETVIVPVIDEHGVFRLVMPNREKETGHRRDGQDRRDRAETTPYGPRTRGRRSL